MNSVHMYIDDSEIVKVFLALKPVEGQKYEVFSLTAYCQLSKVSDNFDSHGAHIWLCRGRVFVNLGVVNDNTYYGDRTPPRQIK